MKLFRTMVVLIILILGSCKSTISDETLVYTNNTIPTAGVTDELLIDISMLEIEKYEVCNTKSSYYDSEPITDGAPFEVTVDNELGYEVLYATDTVNMRSEPNTESDIIGTLWKGDEVKIYGMIGNDTWSWTIDPDTGDRIYVSNGFICYGKPSEYKYTNDELELMAHLVYSENGTEGERCMMYTGSVVLNRVKSQYFPNSIHDVIYQKGQYEVTWNGGINKDPSDTAYKVAERLLKYGSVLPDNVIWQAEFEQGDGIYIQIGRTKFCYSNNY